MASSPAILAIVALFAGFGCGGLFAAEESEGKIMRPVDGSVLSSGQADIIATAPLGKLQLDGHALAAEQPFPDVFHTVVPVSPGLHFLALLWQGGRTDIHFFVGANPPPGFAPFHQHPPVAAVQCTTCHEMSEHGRFRFKGGCFGCHQRETFVKIHTHNDTVLSQCGTCHNAHGSTAKADLLYPKDTACRLCHE